MARKAREKSSTGFYAVILRGNENIFEETAMQEEFCAAAKRYLGNGLWGIRFFDDAVHMLIEESEKGISLDMKPLVTSFARTYNRAHDTEGKVFADRFRSVPIDSRTVKKICIEYLNGGEPAAPYIMGRAAAEKKPEVKKPVKKAEPEPQKPARKKQQLPSWLL